MMSNKQELKTTSENPEECVTEGVTDASVDVHAALRGGVSERQQKNVTVGKQAADASEMMSGSAFVFHQSVKQNMRSSTEFFTGR